MESVSPLEWCTYERVEEIEIRGEGFTGNLIMEEASCTFTISSSDEEVYGERGVVAIFVPNFNISTVANRGIASYEAVRHLPQ